MADSTMGVKTQDVRYDLAKENKQGTRSWRHEQQSTICENIFPKASSAIFPAHLVYLRLRAAVERAKVKVAAGYVLGPAPVVGIEYIVSHEISECEEQG